MMVGVERFSTSASSAGQHHVHLHTEGDGIEAEEAILLPVESGHFLDERDLIIAGWRIGFNHRFQKRVKPILGFTGQNHGGGREAVRGCIP